MWVPEPRSTTCQTASPSAYGAAGISTGCRKSKCVSRASATVGAEHWLLMVFSFGWDKKLPTDGAERAAGSEQETRRTLIIATKRRIGQR